MSKRRLVITAVLAGQSQSQVASTYGVSQGWISRLMARYRDEGEAAFGSTLQQALAKLFPGFREDLGDVVGVGTGPEDPEVPDDPTQPTEDPLELLQQADDLFNEAEDALAESPPDFATYAEKNQQARDLIERAVELLDETATGSG